MSPEDENALMYTLDQMAHFNTSLISNVGITGSLLLHEDLSQLSNDIDLVVYNRSNVQNAKGFSKTMVASDPRFSSLDNEYLDEYIMAKSKKYPGTSEQLIHMTKGRWDTIFVDGMKLDFTFADDDACISQYDMVPVGKRDVIGKVIDASDSYFLPTVLDIESDDPEKVIIVSRGYICLFQRNDVLYIQGEEYYCEETKKKYIVVDEQKEGYIARAN